MSDVNDQGATQDSPAADSSTAENNQPEAAENNVNEVWDNQPKEDAKSKEETEEQPEKPEGEGEKPDDTESEEQPRGAAEERKQQLNTEIRDLVSRRNEIRSEVEKLNSQVYQPQSKDELVEQGLSETDAKVEALRQEIELGKFNEQMAETQLTLRTEAERVLQDFPMFDPKLDAEGKPTNPDYRPELAAQVDQILSSSLVLDPNTGQVIGSNVSPYQLYKSYADATKLGAIDGQVKGQQAAERQLASADPSSSATRTGKQDPLLALWSD
jgi:hypothetical protein